MLKVNMRQCILHLVRHGQTDWNAEKRLQGKIDIALNEVGVAEAELIAKEFENRSLGGIYSSPLQRAQGTAQIINRAHQHEIKLYEALQEATYGSLEGVKVEEYHLKCSEKIASFHDMPYRERLHFKLVDDAESYFEVYQRVRPVLDQIVQNHLGEEVVVVTHGGLMRAVIAMLADIDVRDIQIQNVGYLTLTGDGSKLAIQGHQRIKIEGSV
jgi:broad specificity phosphatase PhoE